MITHKKFIKKHNLKKSDYYQENGWLRILHLNGFEDKIKIKELPSKIEFTKNCNCNIVIEKIKKIPSNVIFNNNGHVNIIYVEEILRNVVFNNNGSLVLGDELSKDYNIGKLKKIHPSVKFINTGSIYLYDIIDKIPNRIVFNNKGDIFLRRIEEISENVVFNNDGSLFLGDLPFYKDYDPGKLEELKKIHSSVKFTNNGYIFLNCIVYEIPSGIVFNNKGDLEFFHVKEISENVTFSNNGKLKFYGKLEKIHPSVNFINNGDISFEDDIIEIPSGVTFNNIGKVDLYYIKKILENVIFNNEGDVIFNPRQKIIFSKGVKFNNKGNIVNIPINISKFLDLKMYLNKMIKQIYK